jgi:hypothetical protein
MQNFKLTFLNVLMDMVVVKMVVELLYLQVDTDSRNLVQLKSIVDHKTNGSAVPIENIYYVDPNSCRAQRMTTKEVVDTCRMEGQQHQQDPTQGLEGVASGFWFLSAIRQTRFGKQP